MRTFGTMIFGLVVFVMCGVDGARQGTPRDELVSLSVVLNSRTPSYISVSGNVVAAYVGEPLTFRVALYNATTEVVEVGSVSQHWNELLAITVVEEVNAKGRAIAVEKQTVNSRGNKLVRLMPGKRAETSVTLETPERLPSGRYRVRFAIPSEALGPRARTLRNILRRELAIEVVDPQTYQELTDYYLHRSYAARSVGQVEEARHWAEQALKTNPTSIPALLDLGEIYVTAKDCGRSRSHREQAVLLLRSGGDSELRLSVAQREQVAAEIASRLTAQCGV